MEFQQNFPLPPLPPSPSGYYNSHWRQLATLKPKQTTMNTKNHHPSCVVGGGSFSSNQNLSNVAQQQPPQQFKKQNRRRLHSSRPYQERLLNMAEARREIVTALKYHRASMHMRQATQHLQLHHQYLQQQQQQQQEQQQLQHQSVSLSLKPSHSSFNQDGRSKSRRNSRIYPSCKTRFSTHLNDISYSSSFSSRNPPLVPNSYPNHNPVTVPFSYPPPRPPRNPKLTLPNQISRLNHNAQHFNNLKLLLFPNNNNNHSSCCSYSSPAPSSTPPVTGHDQDVPPIGTPHSQGEGVSSVVDTIESSATIYSTTRNFHVALDEEGMAEVRSLVEQHQTEWSDTVSFITSAWWFDCLKNMEHGAHDEAMTEDGDDACDIFDELKELDEFHDANESILKQCSEDYFTEPMPW